MRHTKLFHGAIALPLLLATSSAFSSAAGQAESVALDSLTRSYVLSTDSRDAEFAEQGIAKEEGRSVGLDIVSSDNVDLYSVPLSYGIPMSVLGGEEFLNVSADIPYFSAEDPAGGENGLGDISVGAEYFVEQNDIIVKLGVDLKLATGDEEKSLGTDSTDIGFSLTGRKREGELGYNATAAYVIRGEGTVFGVKRDYGNMISLSGGGEYKLAYGFWVGADVAYVRTGTTDINGFEADGLQTLDLIPNASYRLNTDMTVVASLILPVQESTVDGDFGGPEPDREMSINFSLTSDF